MVTYRVVIGGGGGGVCLGKWSFIKGKNLYSNMGAYFGDNMGSYCNSSHLHCRAARITLFSFIARGFKGMLFQESFLNFGCILECILI